MSFHWVYRDAPKSVSGRSAEFSSQQEAEDFMGAEWKQLLDAGHRAATLMDGADEVYTMSLEPA